MNLIRIPSEYPWLNTWSQSGFTNWTHRYLDACYLHITIIYLFSYLWIYPTKYLYMFRRWIFLFKQQSYKPNQSEQFNIGFRDYRVFRIKQISKFRNSLQYHPYIIVKAPIRLILLFVPKELIKFKNIG